MNAPRISRRLVDASILREGFSKLMADTRETLKRYSPEQIARSKTLTARKARLAFYETCIRDFDVRTANNVRKATRKTYLVGVCCAGCGYTVRVTRKWLDVAMLTCPDTSCRYAGKPFEEMDVIKAKAESAEELSQTLEEFAREFEEEKKTDARIGTLEDLLPPEAFI